VTQFSLGAIQSPPDDRDYPIASAPGFAEAPTAFPASYTLPPLVPIALNQLNDPVSGGCVPFSTTTVKQYQERLQTGQWYYNDASAIRLHARCKQLDGIPNVEGTYPRVALQVAKTEGIRAMNGHNYLIGSYYTLAEGDLLSNIKRTLTFYKRPVLLATAWYSNWFSLTRNYTIKPPNGQVVGGHQYMIYGYAEQIDGSTSLRCVNSWGPAWGNKGRFNMPFAYVSGQTWDIWATIDR
jgi:hypothetical protein